MLSEWAAIPRSVCWGERYTDWLVAVEQSGVDVRTLPRRQRGGSYSYTSVVSDLPDALAWADLIVVGVVRSLRFVADAVQWPQDEGHAVLMAAHAEVSIAVEEVLLGAADRSIHVVLDVAPAPGPGCDQAVLVESGMPLLGPGERAALVLRRRGSLEPVRYHPARFGGVFRLEAGRVHNPYRRALDGMAEADLLSYLRGALQSG